MEESISVFDMLKIGVGPSSSHTLGPWRAAQRFVETVKEENKLSEVNRVQIDLYGSLSLTGKGHASDIAVMLGLNNQDPEYMPVENIDLIIKEVENSGTLLLGNEFPVPFQMQKDIIFNKNFFRR